MNANTNKIQELKSWLRSPESYADLDAKIALLPKAFHSYALATLRPVKERGRFTWRIKLSIE